MKTQLRPLSPIEREVAEQNAYMISRFLAANRLPADDWWDVVVFRYLLTVKNWFSRPELSSTNSAHLPGRECGRR